MESDTLRLSFTDFFASKGHTVVPSASLVASDPTVMFTIAGMVPFKSYFLGDQIPPFKRATSVQKCFRTSDIEIVGTTTRHCTFFEMLGNFSFGDYFKDQAIPFAWEFITEKLGIDADRLWITVHESDDEAARIWEKTVGVHPERIQRMGEDNFWRMADVGPCGPCSEIYFDKGDTWGNGGGPSLGSAERYVEIWNLVFMQYNRNSDGVLTELPQKNIDTGAGFERILPILQGVDSLFDTDLFKPIISRAEQVLGVKYGSDNKVDTAIRILADHARAMTFLISDGVVPSNDSRGYVLRRIIRKAVQKAFQLGAQKAEETVVPLLIDSVTKVMSSAYPELLNSLETTVQVVKREEEKFRTTLHSGYFLLMQTLDALKPEAGVESPLKPVRLEIPGEIGFKLHDTYGFPIELVQEIANEHGVGIDYDRFKAEMDRQRNRGRQAIQKASSAQGSNGITRYRTLLDNSGVTEFIGYFEYETTTKIVAVFSLLDSPKDRSVQDMQDVEIFLEKTPFYAESGGQVGDTGTIVTPTATAEVYDTLYALPGLISHRAHLKGEVFVGQDATAAINTSLRDATRRNHTGTHLLQWALRAVLGDHVRQQGSLVGPNRLRFDFYHFNQPTPEELAKVELLFAEQVLSNQPVRCYETTLKEAERLGAIAFFGEKYGEFVRVVEAGSKSIELCGGTHVYALGMIGPLLILQVGSIGSNIRRIEAVTGLDAIRHARDFADTLKRSAGLLQVQPNSLDRAIKHLLDSKQQAIQELENIRFSMLRQEASSFSQLAKDGVVIAQRDGLESELMVKLALMCRDSFGLRTVVLIGTPDGKKVAIVVASAKDSRVSAADLIKKIAPVVGGGGGGTDELSRAGGKDISKIAAALELAEAELAKK